MGAYHARMNSKIYKANKDFAKTSNKMLPINRAYDKRGGITL